MCTLKSSQYLPRQNNYDMASEYPAQGLFSNFAGAKMRFFFTGAIFKMVHNRRD
jgi:hypothetical protein